MTIDVAFPPFSFFLSQWEGDESRKEIGEIREMVMGDTL